MGRLLICDVCGGRHRTLIGRDWSPHRLCNDCFERLDQLDRSHRDPAFLFVAAIARNREAARAEGVE